MDAYNLNGTIPVSIASLTSLQIFSATNNSINGTIPVAIGSLSRLHVLDLNSNLLNGTIPRELGKLSQLQVFAAGFNHLTGPLPSELSGWTHMEHFWVMFNKLSGSIPESYAAWRNVTTFNTYNNSMDGVFPAAFCQWTNLTTLTAAVNEYSGTVPACLAELPKLAYIDLFQNKLTGTIPTAFTNMSVLRVLYLNQNQLHGDISVLCGIKALTQFYVEHNEFTGTIPACLSTLPQLSDLFLHHNFYSGTVPEVLGFAPMMKYIDLDTNLLSGTIPESFSNLQQLSFLFLFDNHLEGSLPPSFSRLANLTLLLLQNNHLTGPLTHVFNASVQTKLNTIQLSGNAFTGAIPEQPFLSQGLYTFSVVDNCMQGSIPTVMCHHPTLNIIALDGMGTAKACRRLISPGTSDAYTVTRAITGGIPSCLFDIPNLTTLHLCGNGLTGSLPPDLTLGPRLVDLALSQNVFTGTIPAVIQQRSWYRLDLSYNRFKGQLRDDFNTFSIEIGRTYLNGVIQPIIVKSTHSKQLSLENNRLSGDIPASVMHLQNISILDGNMFTCDWQQSNLPQGDEGRDNYQCGSNAFDAQYYSWLIIAFSIAALAATVHSLRHKYALCGSICGNYTAWMCSTTLPEVRAKLESFLFVDQVSEVIGRISGWCTLFAVCVLLPLYVGLSKSYSTTTHRYAWTVSAIYMGGVVPFALIFTLIVLIVLLLLGLLNRYRRVYLKIESEEDEAETPKVGPQDASEGSSSRLISAYVSFFAINFVMVCGVNVLFVFIVLYQSSRLQEAAQIGLSFFKSFWNSVGALYLMRWCFHTVASNETSGADFINTQLFVALFNNIAIPCLVVAAVSSDCFYELFDAQQAAKSFFMYLECAIFANDSCVLFYPVLDSTSYTPPFTYSYQCGAQFITSYAPTFVYLGLEVAFLAPLMNLLLLKLYEHATPGSWWFRVLNYNLSKKLKPLKALDNGASLVRSVYSPYFDANQLLVQLMTYLGIILTFGAVFPPLAVVMMAAIVSIILSKKLILGRFILSAVEQKMPQYLEVIELDAEGVGRLHVSKLRVSGWMLASFAFCFYTLFLFDLLGDEVGFAGSFWVFIVLPLMPLGIYLFHKLSRERGRASLWLRLRRCFRVRVNVVVVDKDIVNEVEMTPAGAKYVIESFNPLNEV